MSDICFEDVTVGQDIPNVVKGPMSTAHIMRWSSAMENWHRIHYDWKFATEHDKLPDVMVNLSSFCCAPATFGRRKDTAKKSPVIIFRIASSFVVLFSVRDAE